jgi:hypothetical protein
MDQARGPERGFHPSLGWGLPPHVLSAAELAAFDQAYRPATLPDVGALNSRP